MQTLLNRLVPIFLHNLISDYMRWAAGELGDMFPSASPIKATVVGNAPSPPLRSAAWGGHCSLQELLSLLGLKKVVKKPCPAHLARSIIDAAWLACSKMSSAM
eukprot:SM000162S02402  [mRNA]  locus=s162:231775:232571:- [translate_table: standard]